MTKKELDLENLQDEDSTKSERPLKDVELELARRVYDKHIKYIPSLLAW